MVSESIDKCQQQQMKSDHLIPSKPRLVRMDTVKDGQDAIHRAILFQTLLKHRQRNKLVIYPTRVTPHTQLIAKKVILGILNIIF